MELTRSSPYPVLPQNPAALRQAEAQMYVEQKLLELRQQADRTIESSDQQNIAARRRTPALISDAAQNSPLQIIVQQKQQPAAPTISRPAPLPFGTSSSHFLTQQLAQTPSSGLVSEQIFLPATSHKFEDATSAYSDTRNLTVSILGLQDFRERLI